MTTRTHTELRPGEREQTWYCSDCKVWHTGTVLGGFQHSAVDPLPVQHQPLKSLTEVQSERDEQEAA